MNIDLLKKLAGDHKELEIKSLEKNTKASEYYVHVVFHYQDGEGWEGWVPYHHRRAGIDINDESELIEYLVSIYPLLKKETRSKWYDEEENLWNEEYSKRTITKAYFDNMAQAGKLGQWACRKCVDKITKSSNNARRIQDIKEMGYATATSTRFCASCGENTTHDLLLPLERAKPTGYETWSTKLREKIMAALDYYDVYEDRFVSKHAHLLPDHKFPEIRWDADTKEINAEDMSNDEIVAKFQLMTNQRNEQKREVCRKCYQEGKRGHLFGIKYFYKGDENWPDDIPKTGKKAEDGCIGCGWYDIKEWRKNLNKLLRENT